MESVTLELRPRLRSLSAYMSLKNNIDTSTVKVKLLENAIEIHIEKNIYNLPLNSVKLLPSSLSSLGITNRWISFRIQTQPNSIFGTFETEIISNENKSINGLLNKSTQLESLPRNTNCILLCTCCKNEITKTVCFKRILPLPSNDCDPQEWFCCKHGSEDSFTLDPEESDLFYSINYCVLNKLVLNKNLKLRKSLIHCNRCYSILGSPEGKELRSVKIWNCCLDFKICNNDRDIIIRGSSSPLDDFISTVRDSAEMVTGEKLLLEAQDINSIHYIILRPMEAKLNLLTEDKKNSEGYTVNLKSSYVVKVLYKYGESAKTTKYDPDVKYSELSLPSILAGMDQLVSSSAQFPPAYRRAEDFYIGYLPM